MFFKCYNNTTNLVMQYKGVDVVMGSNRGPKKGQNKGKCLNLQ